MAKALSGYNPPIIESKWQKFWEKQGLYRAKDFSRKPKKYLLVEFPYPSGEGLHVGHCRSYVALDVVARKKRLDGYNVLFPMGWDAFGLPTENYAIKTGIHPKVATKKNTSFFKKQEMALGLSFDWSREINTTDPEYYRWTQWIFLQMFKRGLAYKAKMPINWCRSCKIGLANEEVVENRCERCGGEVEKKEKEQWILKITDYAERLIKDLDRVDYPEKVKILQKEWVGRSEGWEIQFKVKSSSVSKGDDSCIFNQKERLKIKIFTTRIDTIFGCTYLVVAPEHNIILNIKDQISNIKEVEDYVDKSKKKSDRERQVDVKQKTGVELEGVTAINPANGKEIPIFVADYVLPGYGTGAIMAVPAHDSRDLQFAEKYRLPVLEVIKPLEGIEKNRAYEGEGILINSEQFNGLDSKIAKEKIGQWLREKGLAEKKVYYKLRDWIFSRQRYWGEPIPLVFCDNCRKKIKEGSKLNKGENKGEVLNPGWVAVPEKGLPVRLPRVKNYKPTEAGESPLANVKSWVKAKCPKCGGRAVRETDVMPNWAGSNWYYIAYIIRGGQGLKPKVKGYDKKSFYFCRWDKKRIKYWLPVDWYNGGMEHTTLHLLYSRFIYKFLWDIGAVPKELGPEPYKKRTSHGLILAEGGAKMSKSKGNTFNPDDLIKQYGADSLRIYEMFMGPFEQAIAWDTKGIKGARRFLERVYKLQFKVQGFCFSEGQGSFRMSRAKVVSPQEPLSQADGKKAVRALRLNQLLHLTIKKVSEDIEAMKFNTAVSALMVLVNKMEEEEMIPPEIYKLFLVILSPFAPHLAEELWRGMGERSSIFLQKWPRYDKKLIEEKKIIFLVQVNGRVRDKIEVEAGISEEKAKEIALQSQKVKQQLEGKPIKKTIFVNNKLINFVI